MAKSAPHACQRYSGCSGATRGKGSADPSEISGRARSGFGGSALAFEGPALALEGPALALEGPALALEGPLWLCRVPLWP